MVNKVPKLRKTAAAVMAIFFKSPRAVYTLTAGYACLLVCLTHWPQVPDLGVSASAVPLDKIIHGVLYSVLGFLGSFVTSAGVSRRWLSSPALLPAIAVFAAVDEITQSLTLRSPDLFDWLADLSGAALGTAIAILLEQAILLQPGEVHHAREAWEPIE
jgi:VanZ family protein